MGEETMRVGGLVDVVLPDVSVIGERARYYDTKDLVWRTVEDGYGDGENPFWTGYENPLREDGTGFLFYAKQAPDVYVPAASFSFDVEDPVAEWLSECVSKVSVTGYSARLYRYAAPIGDLVAGSNERIELDTGTDPEDWCWVYPDYPASIEGVGWCSEYEESKLVFKDGWYGEADLLFKDGQELRAVSSYDRDGQRLLLDMEQLGYPLPAAARKLMGVYWSDVGVEL